MPSQLSKLCFLCLTLVPWCNALVLKLPDEPASPVVDFSIASTFPFDPCVRSLSESVFSATRASYSVSTVNGATQSSVCLVLHTAPVSDCFANGTRCCTTFVNKIKLNTNDACHGSIGNIVVNGVHTSAIEYGTGYTKITNLGIANGVVNNTLVCFTLRAPCATLQQLSASPNSGMIGYALYDEKIVYECCPTGAVSTSLTASPPTFAEPNLPPSNPSNPSPPPKPSPPPPPPPSPSPPPPPSPSPPSPSPPPPPSPMPSPPPLSPSPRSLSPFLSPSTFSSPPPPSPSPSPPPPPPPSPSPPPPPSPSPPTPPPPSPSPMPSPSPVMMSSPPPVSTPSLPPSPPSALFMQSFSNFTYFVFTRMASFGDSAVGCIQQDFVTASPSTSTKLANFASTVYSSGIMNGATSAKFFWVGLEMFPGQIANNVYWFDGTNAASVVSGLKPTTQLCFYASCPPAPASSCSLQYTTQCAMNAGSVCEFDGQLLPPPPPSPPAPPPSPPSPSPPPPSASYTIYDNVAYLVYDSLASFGDADVKCNTQGGFTVSPYNATLLTSLNTVLRASGLLTQDLGSVSVWVGLEFFPNQNPSTASWFDGSNAASALNGLTVTTQTCFYAVCAWSSNTCTLAHTTVCAMSEGIVCQISL